MLPSKIVLDTSEAGQPPNTSREVYNAIRREDGYINEPGFITVGTFGDGNLIPNGYLSIGNSKYIIFSIDKTAVGAGYVTNSEIGIFDSSTSTYTTILKNSGLNFQLDSPVTGEFTYNYKNELIIIFSDKTNPIRILNIDNLPFTVDPITYLTTTDLNTINLFPYYTQPSITSTLKENGGSLESGAYYITVKGVTTAGIITNPISLTNPVLVAKDGFGKVQEYSGNYDEVTTTKSIEVTLSSLPTFFKQVIPYVVLKKSNDITITYELSKVDITLSSTFYISSLVNGTVVNFADAILNKRSLLTVDHYAQSAGNLFIGKITQFDNINMQQYANIIKIDYTVTNAAAGDYNTGYATGTVPQARIGTTSFRGGEVYAFYAVYEFVDGSLSDAFHIPGRPKIVGTDDAISAYDSDVSYSRTTLAYEIEGTPDATGAATNMGYWENKNETYPNTSDYNSSALGGEDLRGTPVRHHRFPSVGYIFSKNPTFYNWNSYYIKLGISVSNITIPTALQSKVKAVKIYFAQKNISDSIILAQAPVLHAGLGATNSFVDNPGGNWNVTDTTLSGSSNAKITLSSYLLRVNSPDLDLNLPSLSPNYIFNQFKITSGNLLSTNLPPNNSKSENTGKTKRRAYVSNLLGQNSTAFSVVGSTYKVRKVQDPQYVANNVFDTVVTGGGTIDNRQCNACLILRVNNGSTLESYSAGSAINFPSDATIQEVTYLTNICQIIDNICIGINNTQQIVETGLRIVAPATSGSVEGGGDIRVDIVESLTYGPVDSEYRLDPSGTAADIGTGLIVGRRYLAELRTNIGTRILGSTPPEKFYPKADWTSWLDEYNIDQNIIFNFNDAYNSINNLQTIEAFNPNNNTITSYPTRIYRILRDSLADLVWINFLPNDYYDSDFRYGELTNLQGYQNILYIHHKYNLFKTVGNVRLTTDTVQVLIGSGDIFSNTPLELLTTKNGYLGCDSKYSAFVCKLGYFFIHTETGKIFLVGSQIEELSSKGLRKYMIANLPVVSTDPNNPYQYSGIVSAYDEEYNRIIIIKNDSAGASFTISYSPNVENGGGFVSFHDYGTIENLIFGNKNELFTVVRASSTLYKFNDVNNPGLFSQGTYDTTFKFVINTQAELSKILNSLNWYTILTKNGATNRTETFYQIRIYNDRFDTGSITILPYDPTKNIYQSNAFLAKNTWYFNSIKVPNTDWLKQSLITGNYFVIELKFSNALDSNSHRNLLYFYNIGANMTKTAR